MIGVLSSLVVILALLFGGAGATVYAAQDSLPNQALYPLKTASEGFQLGLAGSEQEKLDLLLAYSDRRVGEIAALMAAGEPTPEQVANRLENHIRQALQIAASMNADDLHPALLQIRTHLQSQERTMEIMQNNLPANDDRVLARVRAMLRQQAGLIDDGLQDPENFRYRMRNQYGEVEGTPEPEITPSPAAAGNSYGPGLGSSLGTQSCGECTPVMDGAGPGPLDYGNTPEPGQGQGPGPGPAATPSHEPGDSGGGDGNGGPSTTQEPGGGGNPSPSQEPGGQDSGGDNPGGGQGRP